MRHDEGLALGTWPKDLHLTAKDREEGDNSITDVDEYVAARDLAPLAVRGEARHLCAG
jgi:hypothetical protein